METKVCKKCGRELPVGEFYKMPASKDGIDSVCKECRKVGMRENYKAKKSEALRRKEGLPFNVDDKTGGAGLESYSARELMLELRRRGYSGKLTYKWDINIEAL